MKYNAAIFCVQFPIVKLFVYHLVYYRELWDLYRQLRLKSEFWLYTIDAHYLQAVIQWCMVFGADGCNDTHWKNLSDKDSQNLRDSFRKGLFETTELTPERLDEYWNQMTDFRNRYAAHRDLDFKEPVPDLSNALKIAFFYDRWIREVISPDIFEEPPLEESAERLQQTVRPLLNHLLDQTKQY